MTKMTSAYANKMLRRLEEDKVYWRNVEMDSYVYTAYADEEPLIPEYDYSDTAKKMDEIDEKICAIKHAINLANATNVIVVSGKEMSIDTVLVKMAQLNKRKVILDDMRKRQPKMRVTTSIAASRKGIAEYRYTNYDIELVKTEYERIDAEIAQMQLQLDKYNQTFEFEVNMEI